MYSWSWTTMPPVSITSKRRPSCSAVPCMRSRVIPGSSPTMERRCPVMRLKRVDFPTLGLPTITTVGMAFDMLSHDSSHRGSPTAVSLCVCFQVTIEGMVENDVQIYEPRWPAALALLYNGSHYI